MKKIALVLLIALVGTMVFAQGAQEATKSTYDVVMVVKQQGNGFFEACKAGGEEAAKEIGNINFRFEAPAAGTAEGQIDIITGLISEGVDAICISANDADALIPICKQAMDAGIKVMSFDSSINPGGRLVDLIPSNIALIGAQQVELAGALMDYEGDFAVLSATAQASNQNAWIAAMKDTLKNDAKYAKMNLVEVVYGDDAPDKSYTETVALLSKYKNLKCIVCPTTVGLLACSEAVKAAGNPVEVTGLGLPNEMRGYIHDGTCKHMALWNPIDLGYTSVHILNAFLTGKATKGGVGASFECGRMGKVTVEDIGGVDMAVMGLPFVFTDANVDNFNF